MIIHLAGQSTVPENQRKHFARHVWGSYNVKQLDKFWGDILNE